MDVGSNMNMMSTHSGGHGYLNTREICPSKKYISRLMLILDDMIIFPSGVRTFSLPFQGQSTSLPLF